MTIQLEFGSALSDFVPALYSIKKVLEGVRYDVYRDSVGLATNGAGFLLTVPNNIRAILLELGVPASAANISTMTQAATGTFATDADAQSALDVAFRQITRIEGSGLATQCGISTSLGFFSWSLNLEKCYKIHKYSSRDAKVYCTGFQVPQRRT
jgi:hypothetical protein